MSEAISAVIPLPHDSLADVPGRAVRRPHSAVAEPGWAQALLVAGALAFLLAFLLLPLLLVFVEALRGGWIAFLTAISEPDALAAIRLTLLVTAIVVPLNLVFGVAAAWVVSKHEFLASAGWSP